MKQSNVIIITNRSQERMVVVLEPWADRYAISPGESINIVDCAVSSAPLEVDLIEGGIAIYTQGNNLLEVIKNGKKVSPDLQE